MANHWHEERWYKNKLKLQGRAFNVSRIVTSKLLKKHRETGRLVLKTLILECKGLLLKRHGTLYVFLRPHAAVQSSKQDFEFSKVLEQISGI